MYNPYQGQPANTGFLSGSNYYQPQQVSQPQPQAQGQAQSQPQLQQNVYQQPQQMQSSYGTMPQQNYGVGMNQLQPTSNLQSNQLGGFQSYQPLQTQSQVNQPQIAQPLQQQSTGYYSNIENSQTLNGSSLQQPQEQLQPQGTGYYSTMSASQPSLQPQITNQQSITTSLQPQVTGQYQIPQQPLLPQQTGFYVQQSQIPLEPLKPTATGFVNSFANNGLNNDIKIPAIRLSFITANDQAKFETLFRSAVKPGSNTITGTDCRAILLKSGLPPSQLAKIWALCDTSKAGELLFPEFALAMHLINNVLQGDSIPYELDTKTKNEVNSFIDAINLSIASSKNTPKTPFDEMITAGMTTLQPQPTGLMPSTSFGMPAQITGSVMMPQTSFGIPTQITGGATGLTTQITGGAMMPQTSFGIPPQLTGDVLQSQITGGFQPNLNQPQNSNMIMPQLSFNQQPGSVPSQQILQPQATGYLPPSNFDPTMPLTAQKTGFGNNEIYSQTNFANKMTSIDNTDNDRITPEEKSLFYSIFETYDSQGKGILDSPTAVEIFRKSGLNRADLEHIWNLCDINNSGQLNKQEFALGMHLVYRKLNGNPLPNRLPPSLIPSSNLILDNVKNQLKNEDNTIKNQSKINALNFKNNDDEDALPTFRNRRKIFSTNTTMEEKKQPQPSGESKNNNSVTSSAESKYPPIDDITNENTHNQKSQQQYTKTEIQSSESKPVQTITKISLEDEVKLIERLQDELKAIQIPTINQSISFDLQVRLENVFAKIPDLFTQITNVEKEITDAKIKLFKSKNPSSIIGTGANGEITENDRRKAKSRELLRSRMATLTGKSTASTAQIESNKYTEEIEKIQNEGKANKEVIDDVKTSISDISASLKSYLIGKLLDNDNGNFEKWEFGIGLEPPIRNFIHQLNLKILPHKSTTNSKVEARSDDRTSFLKEQAQKRMKERLAKFGLDRRNTDRANRSRHGTFSVESVTTKPESPFIQESSSTSLSSNISVNQTSVNKVTTSLQDEPDSEDEEERKLQEELERLKLKKKADKQKRLAELRRQLAEAQEEDSDDKEDSTVPRANAPKYASNITQISNAIPTQQTSSIPSTANLSATPTTTLNTPLLTNTTTVNSQSSSTQNKNQYFESNVNDSTTSFDSKAAETQRKIQRGLISGGGDDSDWSDDDNDAQKGVENSNPTTIPGNFTTPINVPKASTTEQTIIVNNSSTSLTSPPGPVPIAPPVPSVSETASPAVPIAPPVPSVSETTGPAVPIAPLVPSVPESHSVTSISSSTNTVQVLPIPSMPVVTAPSNSLPPPPALPTDLSNLPVNNNNLSSYDNDNIDNNDDVLSIPESVDSDSDASASVPPAPPMTIPPPPPLPNM